MFRKFKSLLFQNISSKQTIVKNATWLGISQVAGRLIRGLFIIFAARFLGATEYGVFSYALGLAGFFTLFADIGIGPILTKDASRNPEKAESYFATSFWLKICLLIITTLLIILVAPLFSKIESAKTLLYFVALLTIFDNLREFFNSFFRAKEKMEFEALSNVVMNIAIAIVGAIVLYFSSTAKAITISYVSSAGAGLFVAGFILRQQFKKIISSFDINLIKPTLKAALPFAVVGFLGVFMLNIDVIILGWFRTAAEIGYYAAGQKIIQLLYTVSAIVASAIFPALSRLAGKNERQKTSSVVEKGLTLVFSFAIPLTLGGIILANPIINFLYGSEYLPSILTFQILLLTIMIIFPQTIISNLVLVYNKQMKIAYLVAIAAATNIVLDLILIPRFGIAGSAAGTVIIQTIYTIFTWNLMKKINHFETLPHLKKIFFASVVLGISCFVLNLIGVHILINILISAAVYFGMLFILKEKILEELKPVLNIIRG